MDKWGGYGWEVGGSVGERGRIVYIERVRLEEGEVEWQTVFVCCEILFGIPQRREPQLSY